MQRVFVVDDHAIVREGLVRIVGDTIGMTAAGAAGSAEELFEQLDAIECDVMVLDYALPGADGAEVLRVVRERRPEVKVIVYTMHPEGPQVARLRRAGAAAYLSKTRPVEELLESIRWVGATGHYAPPGQAGREEGAPEPEVTSSRLSARELQIFLLLVDGRSPTDIGHTLGLASSTVSTLIRRIKTKLEVETVPEFVRLAMRWGMR